MVSNVGALFVTEKHLSFNFNYILEIYNVTTKAVENIQ